MQSKIALKKDRLTIDFCCKFSEARTTVFYANTNMIFPGPKAEIMSKCGKPAEKMSLMPNRTVGIESPNPEGMKGRNLYLNCLV